MTAQSHAPSLQVDLVDLRGGRHGLEAPAQADTAGCSDFQDSSGVQERVLVRLKERISLTSHTPDKGGILFFLQALNTLKGSCKIKIRYSQGALIWLPLGAESKPQEDRDSQACVTQNVQEGRQAASAGWELLEPN